MNYAQASNLFKDLGQFKAYLSTIDSFDQLYIIQQGDRGITREQMINRLRNSFKKDSQIDEVFEVIWVRPVFRKTVFGS